MSLRRDKANLNRIKFENRSQKQAREYLIKHYENLAKKVPKYLTNGNLTKSKIKKAKQTLNNAYDRFIKKEGNISDKTKELMNKITQAHTDIRNELTRYSEDIQKAYFDDRLQISWGRFTINKYFIEDLNFPNIEKGAKIFDISINKYLEDFYDNIPTKESKIELVKKQLQEYMDEWGQGDFSEIQQKNLNRQLQQVGYLEADILYDKLERLKERQVFDRYKENENHEFYDITNFYHYMMSELRRYSPRKEEYMQNTNFTIEEIY